MKADHTIILRTIDKHIRILETFLEMKTISDEDRNECNELLIKYRKQRLYFANV